MKPLTEISDTEILLNYAAALDAVWPSTSFVGLICYDPWEEFNDSMFHHLVVETLSYKYQLRIEEIGLKSLAYPWKNTSRIVVRKNEETYKFLLFGYPSVDLVGSEEQYFGHDRPLENIGDMKFSHALCERFDGEIIWLNRLELEYFFEKA